MASKQGTCPECDCEDQIYIYAGRIPIIRVEVIDDPDTKGEHSIIHLQDSYIDSLAPKHKFHCENCGRDFNKPAFI